MPHTAAAAATATALDNTYMKGGHKTLSSRDKILRYSSPFTGLVNSSINCSPRRVRASITTIESTAACAPLGRERKWITNRNVGESRIARPPPPSVYFYKYSHVLSELLHRISATPLRSRSRPIPIPSPRRTDLSDISLRRALCEHQQEELSFPSLEDKDSDKSERYDCGDTSPQHEAPFLMDL